MRRQHKWEWADELNDHGNEQISMLQTIVRPAKAYQVALIGGEMSRLRKRMWSFLHDM